MIDRKQLELALNSLSMSIKKDDNVHIIYDSSCLIDGMNEVALLEWEENGSVTISPFSSFSPSATFSRIPSQRKLEILLKE